MGFDTGKFGSMIILTNFARTVLFSIYTHGLTGMTVKESAVPGRALGKGPKPVRLFTVGSSRKGTEDVHSSRRTTLCAMFLRREWRPS